VTPLRVLITTFNEEGNLPDCLASVGFATDILVVDSFSTDRSVEIARGAGARVLQRAYRSAADQKNWALDQLGGDWVLILDADERVTPALAAEIQAVLAAPAHAAYWIPRRGWFLGAPIAHAGWDRDGVIRLLKADAGRYDAVLVHEKMRCRGSVGRLDNKLEHLSYHDLGDYMERLLRYSRLGGTQLHLSGRRASAWSVLLRPPARFARMYLWQRGFLDGRRGFLLCALSALQVGVKHAVHWAYAHGLMKAEVGDV
jgi:glycosyltransferase involved in cell wall biosynthesis